MGANIKKRKETCMRTESNNDLKLSKEGLNHLKKSEGVIPYGYLCQAKKHTIGVGCLVKFLTEEQVKRIVMVDKENVKRVMNIPPHADKNNKIMTANDELVDDILKYRLVAFEKAVNTSVKIELKQHQFDALLSFIFNVGIANFKKSTLLKIINTGKATPKEIETQFLRWHRAGSVRNVLTSRREKEIKLYNDGVY